MKYKIKIDKEKCIGCGSCVAVCERTFEMRDDGKAYAKKSQVEDISCEKEAESICPVQVIKISKA